MEEGEVRGWIAWMGRFNKLLLLLRRQSCEVEECM
jgi:hypothetical protein